MNTHTKLSEGTLKGVAKAIRLKVQRSGQWQEASPSAEADSKEFIITTYIGIK